MCRYSPSSASRRKLFYPDGLPSALRCSARCSSRCRWCRASPTWPIAGRGGVSQSGPRTGWSAAYRQPLCRPRCDRPGARPTAGVGRCLAVIRLGVDGRARIPARPRRRLDLASGRNCRRAFRSPRRGRWRRAARSICAVSGSVLRRHPDRPQRRRHRCLDAVAHRGRRRAHALRDLARGETKQDLSRAWRARLRPVARLRDRLQPADHRQRVSTNRRRAQRSSSRSSATISPRLRRIGNAIVDVLRRIRRHRARRSIQEPPLPQIVIKVDRAAAAPLRHQCRRHHQSDPDRHRRLRRSPRFSSVTVSTT